MNTLLVGLLGWLCLGFETGLKPTLAIRLGGVEAAPSFVVPLAVIVALCAPAGQALWACLVLGLFMDLTAPHALSTTENITILGPYAIGFLLAGQFVVAIRGLVIRRHPLTAAILSVLAAGLMQIVATALLTAHHFLDPLVWSPSAELWSRLLAALATGVTGLLVSIVVLPMAPLLGYQAGVHRGAFMRRRN
jgi:cell shape-determining protein MreD